MSEVIRFLVEAYYDVQELRKAAFNRIVAYAKANMEKLQSQPQGEPQSKCASRLRVENQHVHASQEPRETHTHNASHRPPETRKESASHSKPENQDVSASQKSSETHEETASVKPSTIARRIVKGDIKVPKEVGELVWYFNSLRETERQLAKKLDGWSSHHPLRINFLSKIQGIGPILSSGIIAWLSPISRFPNISKLWAYCGLSAIHYECECKGKMIKGKLKKHKFLITREVTTCPVRVGKKRKECGAEVVKAVYVPTPMRRKHGYVMFISLRLRTLMRKIAWSFEKQKAEKSLYRRVYDKKKRYYLHRQDLVEAIKNKEKGAEGHVRDMALRFAVKRFDAHLWLSWREIEGLLVTKPYVHDVLGHTGFEPWEPDKA